MFTRALEKPAISSWLVIALSSVWLAVLGNVPLWKTLHNLPEIEGWHGFGVGLAFALIITGITTSVLALLNWNWTRKIAISVLLLLVAFATHYMLMYSIVVDTPC